MKTDAEVEEARVNFHKALKLALKKKPDSGFLEAVIMKLYHRIEDLETKLEEYEQREKTRTS